MRSEGRRLLLAALQGMTQCSLAEKIYAATGGRVKARQPSVSGWASGRTLPEYAARKALRDVLRIPIDAWDEPAEQPAAVAA